MNLLNGFVCVSSLACLCCGSITAEYDGKASQSNAMYLRKEACSLQNDNDQKQGVIMVTPEKPTKFQLRIPKNWVPGRYRCEWKIIAEEDGGSGDAFNGDMEQETGLEITFIAQSDFSRFETQRQRLGDITVTVPSVQFSFPSYDFNKYASTKTFNTPNNAVISLMMNVVENDTKDDADTFHVEISVAPEPLNWPKRFKVSDIIGKSNAINNYRFTWRNARRFCKNYSPSWDLCLTQSNPICYSGTRFSHADVNISTQYFPILPYNTWVKVESTSCHEGHEGPPPWGNDNSKCPEGGCKSKSYIYCCQKEKENKPKKSYPILLHVTSTRETDGKIYYRVSDWEDETDFEEYYYTDMRWSEYWKTAGRLPGDITNFKISSSHSRRTPTPIYFCEKVTGSSHEINAYRFSVDLNPCVHPWIYRFHGYVSKKPRKGLKPLYFGQSPEGDGTRISTTPQCCGYEDPERDFVIYTVMKNEWKAVTDTDVCGENRDFNATSEEMILKSSELLLKLDKGFPVYCTWTIKAQSGYGISVEYEYFDYNAYDCRQNYLRISNPKTKRIHAEASACDKSGAYISDDDVVEITFALEDTIGGFTIKYSANKQPSLTPIKFNFDPVNVTWFYARDFCRNKGLELCTKKDLCPAGTLPAGGIRNGWLPVADSQNDWIGTGYYLDRKVACNLISTLEGPPVWGWKNMSHQVSTSGLLDRSIVYCCDRPQVVVPEWKPVRVNVGMNNRNKEYYRFSRSEDWESPLYRYNYDDPYHDFEYYENVYPWKPPSTLNESASNAVDYFALSSQYVEGIFEKAIYFCYTSWGLFSVPFRKVYHISDQTCQWPYWTCEFHLYAGHSNSASTPKAITVGKSGVDLGSVCCEKNAHNFTFYATDANVLEFYKEPDNDTDYYYY